MIAFAGALLDRAPAARGRPEWLAQRRRDSRARALVLSDRGVWVDAGRLVLVAPAGEAVFLGLLEERPLFALEVDGADPDRGHPAGLREAAAALASVETAR
jgi:hypothetical protein